MKCPAHGLSSLPHASSLILSAALITWGEKMVLFSLDFPWHCLYSNLTTQMFKSFKSQAPRKNLQKESIPKSKLDVKN